MSTDNLDAFNGQTNAENENTNNEDYSKLIIHEEIEGTPFHISGNLEHGYFIRIANYRLTKPQKTIEAARQTLYDDDWNIILNMIISVIEMNEEYMKNKLKQ